MPVSRPLLVALVASLLAAGAFFATSGARNGEEPAPLPAKPAPSKASAAGPASAPAKAKKSAATAAKPTAAKAKPAAAKAKPAPSKGVPADVARAVAAKRTVVILFHQPGSADGDATAGAVAALPEGKSLAVFRAPISRLEDYSAVVEGAGVSQAPAVVILGRGGKARLVEGFVDPETLKQEVADSR
jgi:hypothetical protein